MNIQFQSLVPNPIFVILIFTLVLAPVFILLLIALLLILLIDAAFR